MAEALGAAGSIVGIAAFGLNLRGIALDVSATASALDQLLAFIKADDNSEAIENDSGMQQMVRLASQCKQVNVDIINRVAKSAGIPSDDNGEVSVAALDLVNLNAPRTIQKLIWPFQERRIRKRQGGLLMLKFNLLFHLQLMNFTKMVPFRFLDAGDEEPPGAIQELEAYLIEIDANASSDSVTNVIRKLPFDHRQLTDMLERVGKSKSTLWTEYTSLSSSQREGVDRATQEARRSSSHVRTCVAISSGSSSQHGLRDPHIVVFFSLGRSVEPVHLRFESHCFQFAFELCRKWEGMEDLINHALATILGPDSFASEGKYYLKDLHGNIIPSILWNITVQPGLVVLLTPKQTREFNAASQRPVDDSTARRGNGPFSPFLKGLPMLVRKRGRPAMTRIRHGISGMPVELPPSTPVGPSSADVVEADVENEPKSDSEVGSATDMKPPKKKLHTSVSDRMSVVKDENSDEDEEEDVDIVDFEEELEMDQLDLDGLLEKWTNALDNSPHGAA
ncbi:hypothetical protein F4804DRAFT_351549 [Jackrogersella minutella]|nr:hypothetical protein F4804DRAFT_351549 [Jackrogersella minutella]